MHFIVYWRLLWTWKVIQRGSVQRMCTCKFYQSMNQFYVKEKKTIIQNNKGTRLYWNTEIVRFFFRIFNFHFKQSIARDAKVVRPLTIRIMARQQNACQNTVCMMVNAAVVWCDGSLRSQRHINAIWTQRDEATTKQRIS